MSWCRPTSETQSDFSFIPNSFPASFIPIFKIDEFEWEEDPKGASLQRQNHHHPTLVDRHYGYILFPFNNFTFSLFSSLELFLSCLTQPTTHSTPIINKTLLASTPPTPNSIKQMRKARNFLFLVAPKSDLFCVSLS